MRRLYCLALAAALAPSAAAQITISEGDIRPFYEKPNSTTFYSADTTVSNLAALQALAGQTGGSQTWDFSGLGYDDGFTSNFEPVLPPVPGSEDPHFAQANLILRTESAETGLDEFYGYYILDADEFTSLGVAVVQDDSLQKFKFIPGLTQPLPYTFGSAWASESDIVFEPAPFDFESTIREESEVVGWGTLITPAGSAQALMVRSLDISTSTFIFDPFPPIVTVDSSRSVSFQTEGGLGASISQELNGTATNGGHSTSTGGTASEPVAEGGGALGLEVGPNPVTRGTAQVRFTLPASGRAAVRVYDALGREVATLADGALAAGAQTLVWDASALPAGLYVVRVETDGGAASRRVAVAR